MSNAGDAVIKKRDDQDQVEIATGSKKRKIWANIVIYGDLVISVTIFVLLFRSAFLQGLVEDWRLTGIILRTSLLIVIGTGIYVFIVIMLYPSEDKDNDESETDQ